MATRNIRGFTKRANRDIEWAADATHGNIMVDVKRVCITCNKISVDVMQDLLEKAKQITQS